MVKMTIVGRVSDGLPIAQSPRYVNEEDENFSSYKQQAEFMLKEISRTGSSLAPCKVTIRLDLHQHCFNWDDAVKNLVTKLHSAKAKLDLRDILGRTKTRKTGCRILGMSSWFFIMVQFRCMTNVHTEYLPEIVVACSAGNSGPTPSTVTNVAPWIITVAASSIDRVFPSPLVLGNQMKIQITDRCDSRS
ncbi:unnamed protein product [Camellia sinensis]